MGNISNTLSEFPLPLQSLTNRVDLARIEAYSVFSEEKSADDFYLENFLNIFVALVQYPVSFIVFKRKKSGLDPLFHFCLDKAHYSWFTEMVNSTQWTASNTFDLFPKSLDSLYRIAVVYMHTKMRGSDPCTIVKESELVSTLRKGHTPENSEQMQISNSSRYISACAYYFFESPWYGHFARFSSEIRRPLEASISKVQENYSGRPDVRKWPEDGGSLLRMQCQVEYPNSGKKNKGGWPDRVNEALAQFIDDNQYGLQMITSIANVSRSIDASDFPHNSIFHELQPPNMIIAYRTFDRQTTKDHNGNNLRHQSQAANKIEKFDAKNENSDGYSYNVRLVMPTHTTDPKGKISKIDPYSAYFRRLARLKRTSAHPIKSIISYQKMVALEVEKIKNSKGVAYDASYLDLVSTVANWADEQFWHLMETDRGLESITKILSKEVGSYSRSIADPSFSTGLIHINEAYSLGGMDRIQKERLTDVNCFDDFDNEVKCDLLRIVITYYLFSASAAWVMEAPKTGRLCTMIIPIKMRGSVWGTSIHAFYIPDGNFELMFQHNNIWISNFLLATSARQKIQSRVDGILWARAQRRVLRLLMKEIARAFDGRSLDRAIDTVTSKLRGEQLLSPYALPKFDWSVVTKEEFGPLGEDTWAVSHRLDTEGPDKDYFIRLTWTVSENPFFTARQQWSRKGTRNFLDVAELGLKRGVELMSAHLRAKDGKPYGRQ